MRQIDYPQEGYFFKGRYINGEKFSSDINGCYGFRTLNDVLESMRNFIEEHKGEIEFIEGPFIGLYD